MYGRTRSQTGGLLQIWLLKRFASLIALQSILLGLILLSRELWPEGGALVGAGVFTLLFVEVYTRLKERSPGRRALNPVSQHALESVQMLFVMASCMEASEPRACRARCAAKRSKQPTVSLRSVTKSEQNEDSREVNCIHLWRISKQRIRQIIRPQPVPSRSGPFTFETASISSSRACLRREGEAALGLPKGGGEGNRWGDGLRVIPIPQGLGRGSPVHVRTQMAHVDALHLQRGREGDEF